MEDAFGSCGAFYFRFFFMELITLSRCFKQGDFRKKFIVQNKIISKVGRGKKKKKKKTFSIIFPSIFFSQCNSKLDI
jgi:hypothetical protein